MARSKTKALAPIQENLLQDSPPLPPPAPIAEPAADRPKVPQLQLPDIVVYHAMKHQAFKECQEALAIAMKAYKENKDITKAARLAEAVQGFQRNLVTLAESLEESIDPKKAGMILDSIMSDHIQRQIMAVAGDLQLLSTEITAIDPANRASYQKEMRTAFTRLCTRLNQEHGELRKNLAAMIGAK